jgi:hypothetical protein
MAYTWTWALSADVVATLTVSGPAEKDDVELLADNFDSAKKALLKAARTVAQVAPIPEAPHGETTTAASAT